MIWSAFIASNYIMINVSLVWRNKSKSLDLLRHSKSVHLLQSGVNLIYIRDLLGHSDCSTTQIYAKADTETRRKALEAAYADILPTNELPDWSEDKNLMDFLISLSR